MVLVHLPPDILEHLLQHHLGQAELANVRVACKALCAATYASVRHVSKRTWPLLSDRCALLSSVGKFSRLSTFKIASCRLDPPCTLALLASLPLLSATLRSLELLDVSFEGEDFQPALTTTLASLVQLRHLDLRNLCDSRRVYALAPAFGHLGALTSMGFRYHRAEAGVDDARALFASLARLSALARVDLEGCRLGPPGAAEIARAWTRTAAANLTHLNLSHNALGAEGARALRPLLKRLPGLRHLDACWKSLGPQGARELAPALQRLVGLQGLALDWNNFGSEGMALLAPALRNLARVTRLDMNVNHVGLDGAPGLATALRGMTSLRRLSLGYNCLGTGQAVSELALGLAGARELETLCVFNNELDADHARTLFGALEALPKLRRVNVWSNSIGVAGVQQLHPLFPRVCSACFV